MPPSRRPCPQRGPERPHQPALVIMGPIGSDCFSPHASWSRVQRNETSARRSMALNGTERAALGSSRLTRCIVISHPAKRDVSETPQPPTPRRANRAAAQQRTNLWSAKMAPRAGRAGFALAASHPVRRCLPRSETRHPRDGQWRSTAPDVQPCLRRVSPQASRSLIQRNETSVRRRRLLPTPCQPCRRAPQQRTNPWSATIAACSRAGSGLPWLPLTPCTAVSRTAKRDASETVPPLPRQHHAGPDHRPSVGITYSGPRRAPPGQRCVIAL
jgi:hypothetical protein